MLPGDIPNFHEDAAGGPTADYCAGLPEELKPFWRLAAECPTVEQF